MYLDFITSHDYHMKCEHHPLIYPMEPILCAVGAYVTLTPLQFVPHFTCAIAAAALLVVATCGMDEGL